MMIEGFARAYRLLVTVVLGTVVALLFAIMCLEVVFRYGFNSSLVWSEETCRYLLVWLTFLACGPAWSRGQVTAVRLLDPVLPPRAAGLVMLAANLAALFLLAVLVRYGWRYAVFGGNQPMPAADFIWLDVFGGTGSLGISMFWVYVAVPAGCALFAAHVAVGTVPVLAAGARGGRPAGPGEGEAIA